jgi:hypothetical protein
MGPCYPQPDTCNVIALKPIGDIIEESHPDVLNDASGQPHLIISHAKKVAES